MELRMSWHHLTQLGARADPSHALASEFLGERWTILVLRELMLGSTRFNDRAGHWPKMRLAEGGKMFHDMNFSSLEDRHRRQTRVAGAKSVCEDLPTAELPNSSYQVE